MVAGMTPSTVKAGFVSVVFGAVYDELAGGGRRPPLAFTYGFTKLRLCQWTVDWIGYPDLA